MSMPPVAPVGLQRHKQTCSLCARRKVKCDKGDPCSNCMKAKVQCLYEAAAPRLRKRPVDEDLLKRISLYEALLQKHGIDIAQSSNTSNSSNLDVNQDVQQQDTRILPSRLSESGVSTSRAYPPKANAIRCLWSDLSSELKHPPVQNLRPKADPLLHPTPSFQSILLSNQAELYELHPEPRHIFRLWQLFVDSVNPLLKIVHVPTLQQRVLDASWNVTTIPQPLTATLFAIYTLAVTSSSADDCLASFGETRDVLLARYRAATIRALIASDFLTTRDFEVLQAFVLFLFANPDSELTSTLSGAAIRLGQKMGLQESFNSKISFFEQEMRVRLWWQLHGLDSRNRLATTKLPKHRPPQQEFGEVRFPLNINDADLHPDMMEPPAEHDSPTEMLCVLMKFELFNWLRSASTVTKVFDNIVQAPDRSKMVMGPKDEAINELESTYNEKYLRKSDRRIPLHGLTHAMADLMIARMRFKAHHPRGRAVPGDGEVYVTREENEVLFDSALRSLEMVSQCMKSKFSSHLFAHLTSSGKLQIDSYVYVISELRRRCSGAQVILAWKLVEELYTDYPELIDNVANKFFTALGDLTVDAWEARRAELIRSPDIRESHVKPHFVQSLQDTRQKGHEQCVYTPTAFPDSMGPDGLVLSYENDLDWDAWDNFLQI